MFRVIIATIAALAAASAVAQSRDSCELSLEKFCFEIVRTFHKPVVFSFYETPERSTLFVKIYSGKGGYEWGEVETRYSVDLSAEQTRDLTERFEAATKIPHQDQGLGTDGSMWFLETLQNGFYLRVGFWAPHWDSENRNLADFVYLGTFLWEISEIAKHEVGSLY